MTERTFRIFLGAGLFLLLYITATNGNTDLILYYIALLVFEGVTNWRLPQIITAMKNKALHNEFSEDEGHQSLNKSPQLTDHSPQLTEQSPQPTDHSPQLRKKNHPLQGIPFEAERAMRLVVALILILPLFFSVEALWIIPWFVASMLLLAGLTNICPMVMFFRWLGFR